MPAWQRHSPYWRKQDVWVLRKPISGLSSQLSSHNTSGNSFTSPSFSCLWSGNDNLYPEGFKA